LRAGRCLGVGFLCANEQTPLNIGLTLGFFHTFVHLTARQAPNMSRPKVNRSERTQLLATAVSQWDNEGGASEGAREQPASIDLQTDTLPLNNTEIVQLQIRVIALENVLAVLLAEASEHQLALVREMSAYISPRPGFTAHRLTIHAAARMVNLAESASRLQKLRPGSPSPGKPSGQSIVPAAQAVAQYP
jgi:hypothetical protein